MLAILTTHPIQYQVPIWRHLAKSGRVPFEVWYLTDRHTQVSHDREFGKAFAWDLDTLGWYPYRFLGVPGSASPASFWSCRVTEDLVARLKASGAKVLWIQGWQVAAYWQAAYLAERAGARLWLRAESNDLKPVPGWKKPVKRLLLSQFFGRVDRFLFIGQANRRLYETYGVDSERLHFAPYAVDNERFSREAEKLKPQRAVLRRQWGIPEDAFCVLFCGKFVPKKHPATLIEAARLLHENALIPKLHLLYVGSGELGDALRLDCAVAFDADAGGLCAARQVAGPWQPPATFAGFLNQNEIPRAYAAADCLVLPSDAGETWGLVVNESMASGLACAASAACGCAEDLLTPSWPERVFEAADPAGLARALVHIFRGDRSGDAERCVVSKYSVRAVVQQVELLYENEMRRPSIDAAATTRMAGT